jgi:tripartite-type tricarboxylate transporter receptor subunit TctC
LPSIAELGYPGYECVAWYAILGPAKLPKEITTQIYQDIQSVLKPQDVRKKLYDAGLELLDQGPDEIRAVMEADLEKWTKVIKQAGIVQQ